MEVVEKRVYYAGYNRYLAGFLYIMRHDIDYDKRCDDDQNSIGDRLCQ